MMQPKFSNFAIVVCAVAAVSIAEKVTSVFKVIIAGYPPPRPIVQYTSPSEVDAEGPNEDDDSPL